MQIAFNICFNLYIFISCSSGNEPIFLVPEKAFDVKSSGVFAVVRQESKSGREVLGEWLPLGLVEVRSPGTVYWSLSHAKLVDNQINLSLTIRHSTDGHRAVRFQNISSNSAPQSLVSPPSSLFLTKGDAIYVKWYVTEDSPVEHRLVKVFFFEGSPSDFDLRKMISVSRAVGGGAVELAPKSSVGTVP